MESKKHVFSPIEKKHFLDVLKKYSNVIENKDTDGATLKHKNDAWIRVTAEYNASPLTTKQATVKQLRRLWVNTKQRQREALTKERQHRLATGGGPSISDAVVDPDVSMVAPALIVGIDNAIDSDLVEESSQSQTPDAVEIEHYVLDDVSQTSVISHDQATEDQIVLPDSPIPSTSQISQPFITTIPSARKSPARSNTRTGLKNSVIEQEYKDRSVRATEKHNIEMQILKEQLREAKAKADLAELILKEKQNSTGHTTNN
ncbi:uncharacterized protein LOC124642056 [Helicoverpa zea]|uniref:uncharacterized protein LOC124642056 n=1 Tax=Helicoverpa zea TaxID=7113 RepID=UPI001F591493|nr:uncharacterized protein LOC124642056 [Helicoverpa zea]